MLTRDDVIKSRQNELVNEVFDIERRIEEYTAKLENLRYLKEQRLMEHRLLEELDERSVVVNIVNPVSDQKMNRLSFEDCLIKLYEHVGRPLRMKEIIGEMEKFGYQWSNYHTAYSYITNSHVVEPTGARGYYNIVRARGF